MKRWYWIFAGLVSCLCSFFAMAETPPPTVSSGIDGVIFVSPSRPGPQRIEGPSSAPAGNLLFVVKQEDKTVASFTTDETGHFKVALPPGHYIIAREDPGARIGHWRFEADVAAQQVTHVRWTGDSGMR